MAILVKNKPKPPKQATQAPQSLMPPSVEAVESGQALETPLEEMELDQLADLYGGLKDAVEAIQLNPVFAKFDEVKKVLLDKLNQELSQDEGAELSGEEWKLDISACSKAPRKITDMQKAATLLGQDTFMKLATVTIGNLEKYLNPEQLEQVLSEAGFTTNRTIKTQYINK